MRLFAFSFLALCLCSCSRSLTLSQEEIVATAAVCPSPTRGALNGGGLPSGYTLWLSSAITGGMSGMTPGDYFLGLPFRSADGLWRSEEPVYWPVGCSLDFLALAADETSCGFDVPAATGWNTRDCASGLAVMVPDSACLDSELLYASSSVDELHSATLGLDFRHTQTWLHFLVRSSGDDDICLRGLMLAGVYLGGMLDLSRRSPVDPSVFLCEWNFRGFRQHDFSFPLEGDLLLDADGVVFDVLLPWQPMADVHVTLAVGHGSDAVEQTYVCNLPHADWYDGQRYLYELEASRSGVSLAQPVVLPWGETIPEITL